MRIASGSELCETAKSALSHDFKFKPYKQDSSSAVYLGRHSGELSSLFREVASGYLDKSVYQELTFSSFADNPALAQKVHEDFYNDYLVITAADALEDKIFLFENTHFIIDVVTCKFLMLSERWLQILEYCLKHKNQFLVMGTVVNDRYIHHFDIPRLEGLILVPQFLSDTSEPPELEIGTQMLKKKKKNEPKK